MQQIAEQNIADQIFSDAGAGDSGPDSLGGRAWGAFLRAHSSLLRTLETELDRGAGMALADFDVLVQIAFADRPLRMAELADRVLISRSGMTRRVERLVGEGLVRRAACSDDRRGVHVTLTEAGIARLRDAVPVHFGGVRRHFMGKLDDRELAELEAILSKLVVG